MDDKEFRIIKIRKRDGRIVEFAPEKITNVIFKAAESIAVKEGKTADKKTAEELTSKVITILEYQFSEKEIPTVEEVQDIVEKVLIKSGHAKTAKAYILYRQQHAKLRETKDMLMDVGKTIKAYIHQEDWRVKENSNEDYSFSGLLLYAAGKVIGNYALNEIYTPEIKEAHIKGYFHIHDLNNAVIGYCAGWSLKKLLEIGFGNVPNKVDCKPAKHLNTVIHQMVNYIGCLQMEFAGAQAFSSVDTLLAPFIKADNLPFKEVKQCIQQLVFSLNIPNRWGCASTDTEILTQEGWKTHDNLSQGDKIWSLNPLHQRIVEDEVSRVNVYDYSGELIKFSNRSQEQLLTPNHRVIRNKYNSNELIVTKAEELYDFKAPVYIPVSRENDNKEYDIKDDELKLYAWVISEGSIDSGEREGRERITIHQSPVTNKEYCKEIENVSKKLVKKISKKSLPMHILRKCSSRQIKLFIHEYIKGDGSKERLRIYTQDRQIVDDFQELCAICGYGSRIYLNKNNIFVINIHKNKNQSIMKKEKVKYEGKVWCPTTSTSTWIARRKGNVFITGNSQYPFTNLTFDWTVPEDMKNEKAIVGGKKQDFTYADCQKEMGIINKAFLEVMLGGDAKGRIFTFPIPTYNLTKDFNWDSENTKLLFEVTAKYGLPYFQNYIGSGLDPKSIRAMCCHLNLDQNQLIKRPGGMWGPGDSTGSIGVTTINMNRVGYESKTKEEFFEKLSYYMELAKNSLEIKREMIERNLKNGLMPFTKTYLGTFRNHFSTIGLCGMNECCLNFLGKDISSKEGTEFTIETLKFMRDRLVEFQQETGNLYNLEATPAESSLPGDEKVLIKCDGQIIFTEIGKLIDKKFEENIDKIANGKVLKETIGDIKVFGFDRLTQKINEFHVSALIRHEGKEIYEIKTRTGRKVKVTGDHSVFTIDEYGRPKKIIVSYMGKGNFIAVPRNINVESKEHIFNLFKILKNHFISQYIYLELPKEYVPKLITKNEDGIKRWLKENKRRTSYKDTKYGWLNSKILPLKLLYDLNIQPAEEILANSKAFYRKTKNTSKVPVIVKLDKKLSFIFGAMLAEGYIKGGQFSNTNKEYFDKFIRAVKDVFGEKAVIYASDKDRQSKTTLSKMIVLLFKHVFKLKGLHSTKSIPPYIFTSKSKIIQSFIEGFYLGDGTFYRNEKKNDVYVRFSTTSKDLAWGLNFLLLRLGIFTKISESDKSKINKRWSKEYTIKISEFEYVDRFFRKILNEEFRKFKEGSVPRSDVIPNIGLTLRKVRENLGLSARDLPQLYRGYYGSVNRIERGDCNPTRTFLSKLMPFYHSQAKKVTLSNPVNPVESISAAIDGDIFWDNVVSIKKLEKTKYVYDFEVDVQGKDVENFLGGCGLICLHNTSYRLARLDKEMHPNVITAGKEEPYLTNSTQLPVDKTDDVIEALDHQNKVQPLYTGGTIFHTFLGEKVSSGEACKQLVKKIAINTQLPYFSITPTFSICPEHGYITGEVYKCPDCGVETEVYSRIVGYYRPIRQWNNGKKEEFKDRLEFTEEKALARQIKVKAMIKENGTTVEAQELISNNNSIIKKFRIFSMPNCDKCAAAKEYLGTRINGETVDLGSDDGLKEFRGVYKKLKDRIHRNEDGSLPIPTILLYDGNDKLITVAHHVDQVRQIV